CVCVCVCVCFSCIVYVNGVSCNIIKCPCLICAITSALMSNVLCVCVCVCVCVRACVCVCVWVGVGFEQRDGYRDKCHGGGGVFVCREGCCQTPVMSQGLRQQGSR